MEAQTDPRLQNIIVQWENMDEDIRNFVALFFRLSTEEQMKIFQFIKKAIEEQEQENDAIWDNLFAESQDTLEILANEALVEHRAGRTQPLIPDEL